MWTMWAIPGWNEYASFVNCLDVENLSKPNNIVLRNAIPFQMGVHSSHL